MKRWAILNAIVVVQKIWYYGFLQDTFIDNQAPFNKCVSFYMKNFPQSSQWLPIICLVCYDIVGIPVMMSSANFANYES